MKNAVLIVALAFIGYILFTLGSNLTSSDFKNQLESLTRTNDTLLLQNEIANSEIASIQKQDSIYIHDLENKKAKVVKIKEYVQVEVNKIDNYTEQELVSYLYNRYPKDTITNPLPVAQPVLTSASKDLVAYDGAKEELIVKDSVIAILDQRIVLKDSTISLYIGKETRFKSIISNQDLKIDQWSKQYNNLYLENNKIKLKNKFTKIGAGVIIGGLIYMTIAK